MIDMLALSAMSPRAHSACTFLPCRAPYRYTDEGRFSYSNDEHTFDFFIDRGLTFLCVTNRDGVFVNTFKILKEMSTEFQTNYFDQEGSLNTSYGEQLKAIIENTAQVPT